MTKKTKETDNNKENLLKEVSSKKKTFEKKEKKNTTSKRIEKNPIKKDSDRSRKTIPKKKDTSSKSSVKTTSNATRKISTSNRPVSDKLKKDTISEKTVLDVQKKETEKKVNYPELIKKDYSPEYYDLPFRYNQTVVKILAQTPTNLFIYWDISDEDREKLKKQFGEYVFETTKPVLIIHNKTMNYYFEIDIDDFANSWYLAVNDSNCIYEVELGRRPIPVNYNYMPQYDVEKNGPISPIETPYIYISSSNQIESPNDRILFNSPNEQNKVYFRNVKTNEVIEKDISEFPFVNKDSEFISIYELYKNLYKEELFNGDIHSINFDNPSSGSFSSQFK